MDDRTAAAPFRARRRRGAAALAGLVVTGLALAACGPAKSSTASAPSASPSVSASPSPSPSGAPGSSALTPVPGQTPSQAPTPTPTAPGTAPGQPTPAPVAAGLPAESYQLQNGSHLIVWFYGGICDKYGLSADESVAGQVGVRVVITEKSKPGMACPALVKSQAVAADLKAPLDSRAVIDLTTGTHLPMGGGAVGGPMR